MRRIVRIVVGVMAGLIFSVSARAQSTGVVAGDSLPATCTYSSSQSRLFYKRGDGLYACSATNTWTRVATSIIGNAFFAVTGPTTSIKTFTFPNASATVLTDNALVTAAQGGTSNGFFAVSGPASSTKTFTFPNASASVLTDNAAVTAGQGGTGQNTYTKGDLLASPGGATLNKLPVGSDGQVLVADSASTNGVKYATVGSGGGTGIGDVTHGAALTSGKVIIGNGGADITIASTTGLASLSSGTLSAYAGSSCSSGYATSISASGVVTCSDGWLSVTAASDQDVASQTTPQNDAELFFTMDANAIYQFRAVIAYNSPAGGTTPDMKFTFAGPATLTGQYENPVFVSAVDALTTTPAQGSITSTGNVGTATTPRIVLFDGWASSTAGGTGSSGLIFKFSQVNSGVNATRRLAGSKIEYRRIN